jgi:hypothetical protein
MEPEKTNHEQENPSTEGPSEDAKGFFVHESEDERLLRDIHRPPMEKLMLFTQMIRRERMLKQGKRIR